MSLLVSMLAAAIAAWLVAGAGARTRPTPSAPSAAAAGPVDRRVRERTGRRTGRGPVPSALSADDEPLLLDLCGTLLRAGLPLTAILRALARDVPGCEPLGAVVHSLELSLPWERAWAETPPTLAAVGESLAFAHLTGAATADLLRAAADERRRRDARDAERRAAELGVKLVIPLGTCALPAFICLGVVPVVVSLLPRLG